MLSGGTGATAGSGVGVAVGVGCTAVGVAVGCAVGVTVGVEVGVGDGVGRDVGVSVAVADEAAAVTSVDAPAVSCPSTSAVAVASTAALTVDSMSGVGGGAAESHAASARSVSMSSAGVRKRAGVLQSVGGGESSTRAEQRHRLAATECSWASADHGSDAAQTSGKAAL